MPASRHTDFILTPNTEILKDFVSANKGIGHGIETYPLSEYMLQAVFLKMTGAQEQKMKCICWELATEDYDYRYKRFKQKPLGECSDYTDKNIVYTDLVSEIQKLAPAYDPIVDFNHNAVSATVITEITDLFTNSNLASWAEQEYLNFTQNRSVLPPNQFAIKILFESVLQKRYKLLYEHRNRCAHNTQSYAENLPTLKALQNADHEYDNYFVRFSLLVLIDKIVIQLFQKYREFLLEN